MAISIESRPTKSKDPEGINVPNPSVDPVAEAHASYSIYYTMNKDDSPRESRYSLAGRLSPIFSGLRPGDHVLDIGAGRGIFELEHADKLISLSQTGPQAKPQASGVKFVTVDIADLTDQQLLTADNPNVVHVQASGTELPFADNTFASGFSNLAIDFMPEATLAEFHRVIKPDAPLSVNLHHPETITPPGIEQELYKLQKKLGQKLKYNKQGSIRDQMALVALKHKVYLQDNNILFQNPKQIEETFTNAGFIITNIRIGSSLYDKWWEVDMSNGSKYQPRPHTFKGYDFKEASPKHATVSLVKRLGAVLPSIPDKSTVLSIGVSGEDAEITFKKYSQELSEGSINLVLQEETPAIFPYENKSIAAVFGNVSGDLSLPATISELTRVVQAEGEIILNIHEDPNQAVQLDSEELDQLLEEAGLYIRGIARETTGTKAWWRVDASTMPKISPPLRSIPGQARIYGGEFYDPKTWKNQWAQENSNL